MLTIEVLTTAESNELQAQEARIESNIRAFFAEVGAALAVIQEKRLYRALYGNFEDYCRERWGFGDNYARKLVRASKVVGNLEAQDLKLPSNELQARELSRLADPADQIEAWTNAINTSPDGSPSSEKVRLAVEQVKAGIARTQKPVAFAIGATAAVTCGKHQGQTVSVKKIESAGAVVHAELLNGSTYPFLAGELELIAQPAELPIAPIKRSLRDENLLYRGLLERVLLEAGVSAELKSEIQASLA